MIILALFSISSAYAENIDDNVLSDENNLQNNLQTTEDNSVINHQDTKIISESDDGSFSALQTKIDNTNTSTITLENDYKYDDGFSDNGILINKSLTIDGNGHTIDGDNKARIFHIENSTVIFKNIIFINANTEGNGGAINGFSQSINCTFKDNQADKGGAIFNGNATNCIFIGNSAEDDGGAIFNGSASYCTFENNTAGDHGGAIHHGDNSRYAKYCNFTGNSADSGGAAYNIYAVECIFINNEADKYGGAMYYNTAVNCTFKNNRAGNKGAAVYETTYANCIFENNTIPNNSFDDLSDLISDADDTLYLYDDYYYNEDSDDDYEDGIKIDNDITIDGNGHIIDACNMARIFYISDNAKVTLKNLTLTQGVHKSSSSFEEELEKYYVELSGFGGGAILISDGSTLTTHNVNFINNTADYIGGAILVTTDSYFHINGGKFMGNKVNKDDDYSYGGAIFSASCDGESTITDASFINNYAESCGGAIAMFYPSPILRPNAETTIVAGEFINNSAYLQGGAIYILGECPTMYDPNSYLIISGGTKFINNTVQTTSTDGRGGAIYIQGSYTLEVNDTEFENNTAAFSGGAINAEKDIFEVYVHLMRVNFIGNSASNGGALYSNSVECEVRNSVFINNTADCGYAIYNNEHLLIYYNTINTEFAEIYNNDTGVIYTTMNITVMENTTYELFNPIRLYATSLCDDMGNLIYDKSLYFMFGDNKIDAYYDWEKQTYYSDYNDFDEGKEYTVTIDSESGVYIKTAVVKVKEVVNGSFSDLSIRIFKAELGNGSLILPYNFTYNEEFDSEELRNGIKINSSIYIDGNGYTIDGSNLAGVFSFSNNSTLININIINTKTNRENNTYAISNEGNLTINNTNITGSIYNSGNLTIQDIIIEGTIYNYGEINKNTFNAIINDGETINVTYGETVRPYAVLTTMDGISIFDPNFKITLNSETLETEYDDENKMYTAEYTFNLVCERTVSTTFKANYTTNGKYIVIAEIGSFNITSIESTQRIGDGRNVTLNLNMYSVNGEKLNIENVVVLFNNTKYYINITDEEGSLNLGVLKSGTYATFAIYTVGTHEGLVSKIFTVSSVASKLTASNVIATYDVNKNLIITLTDAYNKPITNTKISVDLNGVKSYTTNSKGQITIAVQKLTPKKYTAKITFNGNNYYTKSSKTATITVKKATPKITAKSKTFKKSMKTKKYAIILKNNNKAMKKATVYLKVKGKTYKAKTNSKGKATFKITKLTKKGKYTATIKYKGNKYYNSKSTKVKITAK